MRKRVLQTSLIVCAIITSAALWARQSAAPTNNGTPSQIEKRVEQFLREYYAWGTAFQIKVDTPAPSPVPGLYQVPIAVTFHGQSDHALVYVSHDGHYVIRGRMDSLLTNPYARNIQDLDIANHPYIGPAKACVNVVEFSDFECPHCRDAHQGLVQVEAHYPQVRFTFMNFPLTQAHPWAMTAALAGECTYEEKPAAYAKLRDLIFDNQNSINPDNAFSKMVGYATGLGMDGSTFQSCMASPATKKLVNADIALGGKLNVDSTPTFFVNGRPLVGWNGPLMDQFITYEMSKCQAAH